MNIATVQQRVANGAALLDRIEPGWVKHITRPINMFSNEDCAIGQVLGSFEDYRGQVARSTDNVDLNKLDAPDWQVRDFELHRVLFEHGFYTDGPSSRTTDVKTINAIWEEEIATRRR